MIDFNTYDDEGELNLIINVKRNLINQDKEISTKLQLITRQVHITILLNMTASVKLKKPEIKIHFKKIVNCTRNIIST